MYFLLQLINLAIAMVGYFFSPNYYSLSMCVVATLIYLISFIEYMLDRRQHNYFTFEIIFSISYFFVFYMFPVISKPMDKYNFIFPYNDKVITKSTFLASVGYVAFLLGNASYGYFKHRVKFTLIKRNNDSSNVLYNENKLFLPIFLCSIVAVLTFMQFFVFHANRYEAIETGSDISGIWSYINILEHGIIMASITISFYKIFKDNEMKVQNIILWSLIGISVLLSFLAGYRAIPMGYAIAIIAGVVIYKGGMSSIKLFFLLIIGFIMMNYIMLMRANNSMDFSLNITSLAGDLITNNYTLYKGFDYVQNNGYVFFPFIGPLITAIPFLLSRVMRLFNIPYYYSSTASFITYDTIKNLKLGMGSNIIISIYLSLGFIGVIIFMYLFGKYVRFVSSNVNETGLVKLLLYFELMAISVYMVRSDLFYSVSHIVWGIIFLKIFQKVSIKPAKQ